MNNTSPARIQLSPILRTRPQAVARLSGGESFPDISGAVRFYQTCSGVLVRTEVSGLPATADKSPCNGRVFGFHIHSGSGCGGSMDGPFSDAMAHYNPGGCAHPYHAGDLPPLFGNSGYALSVFLTDRFSVSEVIGRTVIIHDRPDDFTTQPSGNSGTKIACGVIECLR